ncbi:MAG: DNA polymerase V [PS1 clade bacterium]|jgi:DNA polymerase V|uniref:DNA polymerase V n=1 Tax=PS1 clade bacterium TaxID=2175152 RepID=A0A368E1I3_9PROT|nr:MAG: DNA polymerase V [PS1 clade bacterium]|tara:strand:- start:5811 stop:6233 length:423 start_codon:yes stop_codon:yes gene_type:complete
MLLRSDITLEVRRPVFASRISAGFPSPADDFIEGSLDLNKHLVAHPAATFFLRVVGESMLGAGIHPGDLLVVDRSLTPTVNDIVIAVLHGELTVKRLLRDPEDKRLWILHAENPSYSDAKMPPDSEIWGVVSHCIRGFRA